jgi:hypothetical protein
MQIKAEHSTAMDNKTKCHRSCHRILRFDIDNFIVSATDAARSLYTISDVCASFQSSRLIQRQVAIALTTVLGALTLLTRTMEAAPNGSLLDSKDVTHLSRCLQNCSPIFELITDAVMRLDEHLGRHMLVGDSRAPPSYNAFREGQDVEPQRLLTECFREATRMGIAARAEYLTQRDLSSVN